MYLRSTRLTSHKIMTAAISAYSPNRSRMEYQVIANTNSGQRPAIPPGNRICGMDAIRSNLSDCAAVASAKIRPASVESATPCPEQDDAANTFGLGRAKYGIRLVVIASVPPQA